MLTGFPLVLSLSCSWNATLVIKGSMPTFPSTFYGKTQEKKKLRNFDKNTKQNEKKKNVTLATQSTIVGVSGNPAFINVQSFDNSLFACTKYLPSVHNNASFSVITTVPVFYCVLCNFLMCTVYYFQAKNTNAINYQHSLWSMIHKQAVDLCQKHIRSMFFGFIFFIFWC